MSPHRRRHSNSRSPTLKRRCVLLTVGALLLLAAFVASAERSFAVTVGRLEASLSGSMFSFGEGSVKDWTAPKASFYPYAFSPYRNAWRPFHAVENNHHALVFPLWQPLCIVTALATYGWGNLRGSQYATADVLRCQGCGYSLIGLPESDDRRCPECGRAAPPDDVDSSTHVQPRETDEPMPTS